MGDWPQQAQAFNRVTISTGDCFPELAGNVQPASAAWPTANKALFSPFVVYDSFTVVKILLFNGATASGNVDVGVYDQAGNRLTSAGSTAQAGTNAIQTFDVTDVTLNVGVYYMAVAMDGTTGTATSSAQNAPMPAAIGMLEQTSAFPLPSSATFAATSVANVPAMAITSRSVV